MNTTQNASVWPQVRARLAATVRSAAGVNTGMVDDLRITRAPAFKGGALA